MARVGHVWINTAMGTVGPSPLFRGLVDLDVGDKEVGSVETLGIGISSGVAKKTEKKLGGLLGPASARDTKLFALSRSSSASSVPPHRDGLLVLLDVFQKSDGAGKLHVADSLSGLAGVLEGNAKEGAARLCGLGFIFGTGSVADHRV